jgi:hypothetical protein
MMMIFLWFLSQNFRNDGDLKFPSREGARLTVRLQGCVRHAL